MFTALCGLTLLWSCKDDPTQSEQYKQLEHEHEVTAAESGGKDTTINNLLSAFNNVSENLRAIKEKQGVLGRTGEGGVETGPDMEKRMASDLYIIDSLLSDNKKLIERMRKNAKANKSRISELEKTLETTIANMEIAIAEKDTEITGLKEQLTSTNASLASMIQMYQDKDQQANMQMEELNTAWYCVGTAKELRENNVLTKEGGVIGIGGVKKLNTADLNRSYFKQIDLTKTTVIPVDAKKAKVVTSHPAGSYELVGKDRVENLTIKDTARFWSLSKYLVIEAE